ncbi:hypothetical protein FQN60_009040, partial [Etheostoma spectabile]
NNTLWGSLEEPNIVCANEFEELFSKATLQPVKKPLSDTYEKKAKTKKPALRQHPGCLVVLTVASKRASKSIQSPTLRLKRATYQSKGDDMEESYPTRVDQTGLDKGYNCRHVAPLHWLEEAMKRGHL